MISAEMMMLRMFCLSRNASAHNAARGLGTVAGIGVSGNAGFATWAVAAGSGLGAGLCGGAGRGAVSALRTGGGAVCAGRGG